MIDIELKELLNRLNQRLVANKQKKCMRNKIAFLTGKAYKWTSSNQTNFQRHQPRDLKRKLSESPVQDHPYHALHSSLSSLVSSSSTSDSTPQVSSILDNQKPPREHKTHWQKTFSPKDPSLMTTTTTMFTNHPIGSTLGSLTTQMDQTPAPRAPKNSGPLGQSLGSSSNSVNRGPSIQTICHQPFLLHKRYHSFTSTN